MQTYLLVSNHLLFIKIYINGYKTIQICLSRLRLYYHIPNCMSVYNAI